MLVKVLVPFQISGVAYRRGVITAIPRRRVRGLLQAHFVQMVDGKVASVERKAELEHQQLFQERGLQERERYARSIAFEDVARGSHSAALQRAAVIWGYDRRSAVLKANPLLFPLELSSRAVLVVTFDPRRHPWSLVRQVLHQWRDALTSICTSTYRETRHSERGIAAAAPPAMRNDKIQPWRLSRSAFHAIRKTMPGYEIAAVNREYWSEVAKAISEGDLVPPDVRAAFARLFGCNRPVTALEPWQMSRGEFHQEQQGKTGYAPETANLTYWQSVKAAIAAGKDVPMEVRAEYASIFGGMVASHQSEGPTGASTRH